MYTFLFSLLYSSSTLAQPSETPERFPQSFVHMLAKGGWTPSPSNTARYGVGDVFDFSRNKELTKGSECFSQQPEKEEMADVDVSRSLKAGFHIPLGLFKSKAKGKKYKRYTYSDTAVQEFSQLQLDRYMQADCKGYLRNIIEKSPNPSAIQLVKAVVQSQVNEQLCTSVDGSLKIIGMGVNGSKEDKCQFETQAAVTVAYQLIPVTEIAGVSQKSTSTPAQQLVSTGKTIKPTQSRQVQGDGYNAYLIPSGRFIMGCTSEPGWVCKSNEKPSHEVNIRTPFYMMQSEVTQALYQKIMDKSPSYFGACGDDCPVEQVSWVDALQFANRLSREEGLEACYNLNVEPLQWSRGLDCTGWRLPTEAEWEWAARGGERSSLAGGEDANRVAWHPLNSVGKTHSTCEKSKNGYGLCDMSGNVYEWVWDNFASYDSWSVSDPLGSVVGKQRVIRGGSWFHLGSALRVSHRSSQPPSRRNAFVGFRLVRTSSNMAKSSWKHR